jgi:hypothetical protein
MNAPGGSRYLAARHFTTPDEGAMHHQSTDSARSKEERALEAVASGRISIDADGRIWKHWRRLSGGTVQHYDPPRRADHPDKLGYCRASIPLESGTIIVYAHRLAWVAANGRVPEGLEINHKDGNKRNNRLDNLELVTHRDNQRHAYHVLGKHPHLGIVNVPRKLTWEQVCELRRQRMEDVPTPTYRELAKQYGVSDTTVRAILIRKFWKTPPSERSVR